jgi:NAD(P)-dependent dehydrogenase (short-subunit alcohol dehydrogenase family)
MNAVLDTLLDRTVLPGYTTIGYRLRRPGWDELPRMDGQVVLVTGATSGIGRAAAEGFARLGAGVRILARDGARGEGARAEIVAATGNRGVRAVLCDLSDLGAVRAAAERLLTEEQRLDVLVNNAGFLPADRRESVDGIELAFATNVLGPFLLTNMLLPLLERSAHARIISVSSGGMYAERLDVDDLETSHRAFDGSRVYARTKRAQVVLTELWAERLQGTGVVAHAMHPGWADTPGVRTSLPTFRRVTGPLLRSPEQGADTILWLGAAAEPGRTSGCFWHDRRARPTHLLPWTRESADERARLWSSCTAMSGWEDPTETSATESPG